MSPAEYKSERQRRGTLKSVAAQLGVHWTTLARRESAAIEITIEAGLALRSLPLRSHKSPQRAKSEESKQQTRPTVNREPRTENQA